VFGSALSRQALVLEYMQLGKVCIWLVGLTGPSGPYVIIFIAITTVQRIDLEGVTP